MSELLQAANAWAAPWSASMVRTSLQAAAVIAGAWVVARWFRFLSPRLKHWIWRLVCLKVLVSFLWIQPIAIAVLHPPATPPVDIEHATVSVDHSAPIVEVAPPRGQDPRNVAAIEPAHRNRDARMILMLLWATGMISCMVLTLRQWFSALRLRHGAVVGSSKPLDSALESAALQLGIDRVPQLRLSPHVEGPVLTGIWRPTILLPLGIDTAFDDCELRLMIAHELAHFKRHDLAWNWLPTVVGWLLFFHPLVWLMKRSWLETQEAACDEMLIQNHAAQPATYGRLLLKLATYWPREPRAGLAAAGVLGAYRNLERRIIAMADIKPFSRRRLMVAAAMLLLMGVMGIIPWRLVAREKIHEQKTAAAAAIKISNVQWTEGKHDGAVKIHFDVDAPGGTFFYVRYNSSHVRGASQANSVWKIDGEHGAQVDLTLSYLSDFKGDFSNSVLLSTEENLGYQIQVKHATTPGLSTVASVPLFSTPPDDRLITVDKSSSDWGALAAEGARRVFWVCKKSDAGKDPDTIEPRCELVVGIHDDNTTIMRSKQTPFQEISWKWKAQQYMIGAAHIKYRHLFTGASDLAALPREKVNEILASADLENHPENFVAAAKQLLKPRDDWTKLTEPTEFYCLGPKTKEINSQSVRVFDGELDLDYDIANNRIRGAIGYSSRTARTVASDFRIREPSELQPTRSEATSDGRLLLRWDATRFWTELVADPATGFIRRESSSQGKSVSDAFQYAPKKYPGGILFPTLLLRATYVEGILEMLELRMIESAQFNEPQDKNTFILPAKRGMYVRIVDPGNPVAEVLQIQLPMDVPDVAAYLSEQGYVGDSTDNSTTQRGSGTSIGELLIRLKKQNASETRFKDPWLRTLKEIVEHGPEAVPALVEELDATDDNMMLRCLGFTVRAIGDQRAVPGLIRAIPKTLQPSCSDMGLLADDPELAKFAQKYDIDGHNRGVEYDVGRPVREIFAALEKLTGQKFDEQELYSISMSGLPAQQQMKRALYYRTAKKWAEWWQQNAANYTQDPKYAQVGLAEPAAQAAEPLPANAHLKLSGGMSGQVLQVVSNPKSRLSFYDLDTGRHAALPGKWRELQDIDSRMDEIVAWAGGEGFDLMGVDYVTPDGKHHFAIRPIGLRAWELPANRWKLQSNDIAVEALQSEGTPVDGLLLHRDKETKAIDPAAVAPFLYITREGTPGLLYVGVEVLDDSLRPGGISMGEPERNPVAFSKGRRFGYCDFEQVP